MPYPWASYPRHSALPLFGPGYTMDELSALLLELYRGAQVMPLAEFPNFALALVRGVLPSDSGRLLLLEKDADGVAVQGAHLYNEPVETVPEWAGINRLDPMVPSVIAQLGLALSFHAPTHYAGRERVEMLDYARRHGHQNARVVGHAPKGNGARREMGKDVGELEAISLFRANPNAHFGAGQSSLLTRLAPHLLEALAINRALALRAHGQDSGRGGVAIVREDGLLLYCDGAMWTQLQDEWPDWRGPRLPSPLWLALVKSGSPGHVGGLVRFAASRIGSLLFLSVERVCPLDRLTAREIAVARMYGAGKSYKEIAQQTKLSPATVRNYLARVYAKLKISGKAELAVLLARHPAEVS